jgi:hypothetical protein
VSLLFAPAGCRKTLGAGRLISEMDSDAEQLLCPGGLSEWPPEQGFYG